MSYIGPVTQNLLEAFGSELKKKDTKEKIMKYLLDPIVAEFFRRYSKYIFCFVLVHIAIVLMLIYVVYKVSSINLVN